MKYKKMTVNLLVENVDETVRFYMEKLGFSLVDAVPEGTQDVIYEYNAGQDLKYAMVACGDIGISFQNRGSMANDMMLFNDMPMSSSATYYFEMDNFEKLYESICDSVEIVCPPEDKFYGLREFYIRDLNGYILGFSQPVGQDKS